MMISRAITVLASAYIGHMTAVAVHNTAQNSSRDFCESSPFFSTRSAWLAVLVSSLLSSHVDLQVQVHVILVV